MRVPDPEDPKYWLHPKIPSVFLAGKYIEDFRKWKDELRQLDWKKIQKTLFSRTLAKYRYLHGDVKRETDFEAGFMAGFYEAIRMVLGEEASEE